MDLTGHIDRMNVQGGNEETKDSFQVSGWSVDKQPHLLDGVAWRKETTAQEGASRILF